MENNEIWKKVPGYYGYEVSNQGKIRSYHKGGIKPVKTFVNSITGYLICNIESPGIKRITKNLHKLVAEAFIENPNNYPTVDHKNHNKLDNSVENLRYMPKRENCQRTTSRPVQITDIETGDKRTFLNCGTAAEYLGICTNSVRSAAVRKRKNGKRRVCKGYYVDFVDIPPSFFTDGQYEEVQLKD